MKKIKIARVIILIGIISFLVENTYFGWNFEPQSDLEQTLDKAIVWIFKIGFIFYLMPIFSAYEKFISEYLD